MIVALAMLASAPLVFISNVQARTWSYEIIDSNGPNYHSSRAFALDASGNPHVLYFNSLNHTIYHAARVGGSWHIDVVDSSLPNVAGLDTDLALDNSNTPHAAYRNQTHLWYARWNSTHWSTELLNSSLSSTIAWVSIAVSEQGFPSIVYNVVGPGSTELLLARWNGSGWTHEVIDSGVDVGLGCKIVLDRGGHTHVAYVNRGALDQIIYAHFDGVHWVKEVVYSGPTPSLGPGGIAVDALNQPHITFLRGSSGDLMYARRNETRWSNETVDSVGLVGWESSIALDLNDRPYLSYWDAGNGDLKYARWNGSAWIVETVDSNGDVGRYSAIGVSSNAQVHIVYRDDSNSQVKYAFSSPDNPLPHSYVVAISPYWRAPPALSIQSVAWDPGGSVTKVDLYRRADNGTGWSAWLLYSSDASPPWQWSFDWPDGEARYEFYSMAFDGTDWEVKMPSAEASAGYDITPPTSTALRIAPYWWTTPSLTVNASAADNLSRVSNVTLFYNFAPDNLTWGSCVPFGTASVEPWSWSFSFPYGEGYYRFHTIASDVAGNVEGSKSCDEATAAYRIPFPDLVPLSLDMIPPSPVPAMTITVVSATVANQGDLDAGGFDVLAFDDANSNGQPDGGESIGTSPVSSLAGHSQTSVSVPWTATPPGNHRICAYIDPPPGTVIESDETNNVMCIDVLVQPGPVLRPDYVPVSSLPLPPIKVGLFSPVSLSIKVLNQGNGTATDDATVAFYEQSSPPFSISVLSPLAPATTSSRFTATWTSPAIPGTYHVIADVDYWNNLTEWDEANNLYAWTIEVVNGPITSLVIGIPNYTSTAAFVTSSTPIDFSINDQSGMGIRNTTYRIDGGNWVNYTATGQFVLAGRGEGQHTIEWHSEDYAGNVEDASLTNLTVDDTPPATTVDPDTAVVESGTCFTLDATDSGSGVNYTEYRVDGGTWARYTASFTLSDGGHNITYRSVDNLGNMENEKYLNVTVSSPYVPPAIEANYKPLVALVFAVILAVVGLWSSKKKPWKGGKDWVAVAKAFAVTSLPFVLAEAGTGLVSFLTGELSIPPLISVGAVVDSSILLAGVLVAVFVGKMKKEAAKAEA